MAEGLNQVTLIGNMTEDGVLRFTQSNQGVLTVRLACTESYYDTNTKERKEITEYVNVVVWGKRGEALHKIVSKGKPLAVTGRLRTSSYEAKDGSGKRYKTEVIANNVILLGGRGEGQGQGAGAGSDRTRTRPSQMNDTDYTPNDGDHGFGDAPPDDDEIPF